MGYVKLMYTDKAECSPYSLNVKSEERRGSSESRQRVGGEGEGEGKEEEEVKWE